MCVSEFVVGVWDGLDDCEISLSVCVCIYTGIKANLSVNMFG